jgi:hypothetical protein
LENPEIQSTPKSKLAEQISVQILKDFQPGTIDGKLLEGTINPKELPFSYYFA